MSNQVIITTLGEKYHVIDILNLFSFYLTRYLLEIKFILKFQLDINLIFTRY